MKYQRYSNKGIYWGLILLFLFMVGGFQLIFLLFGLALSLLINFFPLILMGYVAYRFVKRAGRNRYVHSAFESKTTSHKKFVEIMVHILMHIAKADGKITQSETQTIRQFFIQQLNFSGPQIEWLNDTIETAKTSSDSLQSLATEFNRNFAYEAELMLVNMVYNVAYADGTLHNNEASMIQTLVNDLRLSQFDHQRIKMAFAAQYGSTKTTTSAHYATLGVSESVSDAELKRAYRELSKKYHPDKVQHLGDEFKKQAEKKMKDINHAYDELLKHKTA